MGVDSSKQNKSRKNPIRLIVNITLFTILTLLALYYVLKDHPLETLKNISSIAFFPFLLAIILSLVILLLDGLNMTLISRLYQKQYTYRQGISTILIGNFIGVFNKAGSNIMQAYTLTKQNVKPAHAASILTMNFLMYQLTLTLYSFVMVFVGYSYVKDIPITLLGNLPIVVVSLLGFSIDLLFLLILFLIAFSKKFHHLAVFISLPIVKFFHPTTDKDTLEKEWLIKIATYRIEVKRLFKHKGILTIGFLLSLLKQLITNSLPYLVFLSLKLPSANLDYLSFLSGASYLNLITTFIPAGAPEVAFQSIYSYLLSNTSSTSLISAANLLWRFLTFYLPFVLGILTFVLYKGSPKKYSLKTKPVTMYNLQVVNLKENPNETKPTEDGHLLSEEEVQASFDNINNFMEEREAEGKREEPIPLTLSLQKKQLSDILKEVEEMQKQNAFRDVEMEAEAMKELNHVRKRQRKKILRQEQRKQKKLEKMTLKAKKAIEKMQPLGGKVTISKDQSVKLSHDNIIEVQTRPSRDENEIDKTLDK